MAARSLTFAKDPLIVQPSAGRGVVRRNMLAEGPLLRSSLTQNGTTPAPRCATALPLDAISQAMLTRLPSCPVCAGGAALYHAKAWTPRGHGHGALGKPRTAWGLSGPGARMPPMWNLGRPEEVAKALNIPTSTDAIHYPRPASAAANTPGPGAAAYDRTSGRRAAAAGRPQSAAPSPPRRARAVGSGEDGNSRAGAQQQQQQQMRASRSLSRLPSEGGGAHASAHATAHASAHASAGRIVKKVSLVPPSELWRRQVTLSLRPGRSKQGAYLAAAKPQYTSDPRLSDPRRLAMRRGPSERLGRADDILAYPLRDRMWSPERKTTKQLHTEWRGAGF